MWVINTDGFYSAVQHSNAHDWLVVRSRTQEDSQRLADWLNANTSEWHEPEYTPNRDYLWRMNVRKPDFGKYLATVSEGISYPNFKSAVAERQGGSRALTYSEVWAVLLDLQATPKVGP